MSGDRSHRSGVTERIAVLSVAVSIVVMILAMAVMRGFKEEVSLKMTGFSAHVTVQNRKGYEMPVPKSDALETILRDGTGYVSAAPFALKEGIVRTADAVEGVALKGVDSLYASRLFASWLVEGTLPRIGGEVRTKDILIARALADKLRLKVGDKVEMLFVERNELPHRDRFKVAGIYSSGMDEIDRALVLTDIRNVQRLMQLAEDEITGYEVMLRALDLAPAYADEVNQRLVFDDSGDYLYLRAEDVVSAYPNIFDWLKAHDVNSAVILIIMLVVAFFNMAVALLVLVLERTPMIGVLKAMGMRNATLRRIFLYRSAFIALRGLAWGNAVGLGLAWLQGAFHIVGLDSEGYLLSAVPISLDWGWWLALNAGFILAIVALLILPASIVATIKPEETIKYE